MEQRQSRVRSVRIRIQMARTSISEGALFPLDIVDWLQSGGRAGHFETVAVRDSLIVLTRARVGGAKWETRPLLGRI